jgi:hypothetical protein
MKHEKFKAISRLYSAEKRVRAQLGRRSCRESRAYRWQEYCGEKRYNACKEGEKMHIVFISNRDAVKYRDDSDMHLYFFFKKENF